MMHATEPVPQRPLVQEYALFLGVGLFALLGTLVSLACAYVN